MQLAEIRAALTEARVALSYQPMVRLSDGVPVALEALVRISDPAFGSVLPDRFVPQIEAAGLAGRLTELVAATAFADLAGPALGPLGISVSINLPLDLLLLPSALERLDGQRVAAGVPVERVVIELTESRPVEDLPALACMIEHLDGAGYQVLIDDVGPGIPNLDELLALPFAGMKLDKALVQVAAGAAPSEAITERLITRAKARGLMVVAEGVEDEAQWRTVEALGADQAQGFLIAAPMQAGEVCGWAEAWMARVSARTHLTPPASLPEPPPPLLERAHRAQEVDTSE